MIETEPDDQDAASQSGDDLTLSEMKQGRSRHPTEMPTQIGRFRIQRELGRGGFGVVYLGRDDELRRSVAIKVPHAARISDPEDLQACLREAQTLATFNHPSIVTVHDVGQTEDFPLFIVSQYIEGSSLAERAKQRAFSQQETVELIVAVAEALHYAHTRNVVHRDVTPGNILLDAQGKPHLVDFRIALTGREPGSFSANAGTPAYMSPEQAAGGKEILDARTDIYSLGAVFYELLTRQRPFVSSRPEELLRMIVHQQPTPPTHVDDSIPRELERICLRCLAKQPELRYATAADLVQDLASFRKSAVETAAVERGRAQPRVHLAHHLIPARDWQDREESNQLRMWWKRGAHGVLALVGIGGTGKTALAERFVYDLKGAGVPHVGRDWDAGVRPPTHMFVYSFYDRPSVDAFVDELGRWLRHQTASPSSPPLSFPEVVPDLERFAETDGHLLIVLDGLERFQTDSALGGVFGCLSDRRLRDLFVRVANEAFPKVSLLATTRLSLVELRGRNVRHYTEIEVDRMPEEAAIALLRACGAVGSRDQLARVAQNHGLHALLVELAGRYIAHFCNGSCDALIRESPVALDTETTTPIRQLSEEQAGDDRALYVSQLARRVERVVERYCDGLRERDPDALALLQRISQFLRPVDIGLLTSLLGLRGKNSQGVSQWRGLSRANIGEKLNLLVAMRLVEATVEQESQSGSLGLPKHGTSRTIYSAHPLIKESFLKRLDSADDRDGHRAAGRSLEAAISLAPRERPRDVDSLDRIEEVIYHVLKGQGWQAAWEKYLYWLGGFDHLGWRLGAFEKGARILETIASDGRMFTGRFVEGPLEMRRVELLHHWGMYLLYLGDLDAARGVFEEQARVASQLGRHAEAASAQRYLAVTFLLQGRLPDAMQECREAARTAGAKRIEEYQAAIGVHAIAQFLAGDVVASKRQFRAALDWQLKSSTLARDDRLTIAQLIRPSAIWYALAQVRTGNLQRAVDLLDAYEGIATRIAGSETHMQCPFFHLVRAEISLAQGDRRASMHSVDAARGWASRRSVNEALCWAASLKTKVVCYPWTSRRLAVGAEAVSSQNVIAKAQRVIDEGLHIARNCGFGIYNIDLLLQRSRLRLIEGRAVEAERDSRIALFVGVEPPWKPNFPSLPAACDPECGYLWGEAEGRQLLAESLLLRAAQSVGTASLSPGVRARLPSDTRHWIDEAGEHLERSWRLRERARDPMSAETKQTMQDLERGILTHYPVRA